MRLTERAKVRPGGGRSAAAKRSPPPGRAFAPSAGSRDFPFIPRHNIRHRTFEFKRMKTAPYGSWASPLSAEGLAAASVRFGRAVIVGDSIFCSEGRPGEGGRNVVVECDAAGRCSDVNPAPFDARTRVHEYGGGA